MDFMRFHARQTVLGTRLPTWEIEHVKEQTCMLLIIHDAAVEIVKLGS